MTDLVYRLRKRAEIRRQIPTRRSVQENKPDRIASLLEEAAQRIEDLEVALGTWFEKTEWVQRTCEPHELGLHRADVLRNRVEGFERDTLELLREYAEHTQKRLEFFPLQYESEKFEQVAVLLERYWAAKRS